MDKIKKQISETVMEYDERGLKGANDVDQLWKLLLIMWLCKEVGEDMGESYEGGGSSGYSGRRRDSMGRYARDSYEGGGGGGGGGSYDSYEGGGSSGYSGRRGYSRHDPKQEIMEALEKAKRGMKGEEKEVIHRMMQMADEL